jgi:Zn-dependent protease with chaperone function
MKFHVHPREKVYFALMLMVSLACYGYAIAKAAHMVTLYKQGALGTVLTPTVITYSALFLIYLFLQWLGSIYLIGYLRGNAVRVHNKQFPEVFEILKTQAAQLGLKKVPALYVLQGNGILNAFATRVARRDYVVLYCDVLAAAYQEGISAVEFIIGHELGHIKRNHVSALKSLLLLPAHMIPILGLAYSRACEYTCDNIGYHLCPEGAEKGILILAAGRELYNKIDVTQLLLYAQNARGFAFWLAEILATHPPLVKRVAALDELRQSALPLHTFVMDRDREAVREFDNHQT